MNGELTQKELKKVKKQCKELGIIPVINPPKEDLRLTEVKRLNMLERGLNHDIRYSSLTELAAYLTGCPYSAINVLGSTFQRCKIIFGLSKEENEDFDRDEPRDLYICQYSLTKPHQPLVIENLLEDQRTKSKYSHPEASNIRFYAGASIISSRGFSLGTLCVVDDNPKCLKHNQVEGLHLLADQIVSLIESDHDAKKPKYAETTNDRESDETLGRYYSSTTILFADIIGFTAKVERLDPG